MKYLLSSLILLVAFVSCQKEITGEIVGADGDTTISGLPASFRAKINGVQWEASLGASAAFATPGNGLPPLINISGIGAGNKTLTITLKNEGVAVYTLKDTGMRFAAYTGDSASAGSYSTNQGPAGQTAGTVEITKIDTVKKTLSGRFSFKVYRMMDSTSLDFTEGTFTEIPYIGGNALPPTSSTDTFRVKISDTLFRPFSIRGAIITFNNTLSIYGADSLGSKNVGLNLPAAITPGNYDFSLTAGIAGVYNTGTNPTFPLDGKLQLLEHNTTTKRIRGSFNFNVMRSVSNPTDTIKLTEGYFSVKYQ